MSKPHLRALEEALGRRGWRVIAVHPGNDHDISASWEIQRSPSESSQFIDFDGQDDLDCLPLEESFGCHVRGRSAKVETPSLYFRKRNKSRALWQQELAAFVLALDNKGAAE
jgi:hypothetical protein